MEVTGERGGGLSFIAAARRTQIVSAAIETIAEHGFAAASFARIAERAELSSTRLISYHFTDKKDLISEVVVQVLASLGEYVGTRVQRETTARGALHVYLRANIEFTASHRTEMKALLAVFTAGGFRFDAVEHEQVLAPIEAILRDGQAAGEFRAFDTYVMASVVQRCVEGYPILLETRPDLDLDSYSSEITTMVDLATRRTP
ncbi:TetR family transcriptional regulator [Streptacidiphilus sp. EB129]|jgi:AcrR family transcriptional regulator|uniref:TetR family transcriptional regulator n=1 Tax=Streptacidiphilus sp. EB129 TaxID=3156262 RepID=UPI0035115036